MAFFSKQVSASSDSGTSELYTVPSGKGMVVDVRTEGDSGSDAVFYIQRAGGPSAGMPLQQYTKQLVLNEGDSIKVEKSAGSAMIDISGFIEDNV